MVMVYRSETAPDALSSQGVESQNDRTWRRKPLRARRFECAAYAGRRATPGIPAGRPEIQLHPRSSLALRLPCAPRDANPCCPDADRNPLRAIVGERLAQ